MENRVTAGSPISQSEEKVKTFFKEISEVPIAQNSENVKRYSEFFTKCLISQSLADVKSFFEIIFNYLMMKREAAMLREELDTTYYRMYVYPRTLKGASTVEFVKTNRKFKEMYSELEKIDDCVEEIEMALDEAHLLRFVNTFFENISLDREFIVEVNHDFYGTE